jgi:gas vesicle protein
VGVERRPAVRIEEGQMHLRSFFTGAAVGAAAAYLLDPVAGNGRRARLRDQTGALIRRGEERADDLSRHATNVVQGKVREMTTAPERSMDDGTVEARVRSEVLGRGDLDASRVIVNVEDGVAVLRGEVSGPDAIAGIVDRTKAVEGVREVRNLLHVPGAPAPNKEAARAAKPAAGTSGTSGSSGRSGSSSTGSSSPSTSGSSSSATSRSSSPTKPSGSSGSSS